MRRKKGRMNEIPILVRCEPKASKSSIWARIVQSWTKSVSESGVSAGFEMRDRLSNFRDSGLDFTGTDGKEAVSGFPAKKFRKGRACRFPTNSIMRLLPREERADFHHSGTSQLWAFERKNERISNIRATTDRRRKKCQFV